MQKKMKFTIGIEEEYLVVDRSTLDVVRSPEPEFMEACRHCADDRVTNEYLQCQVEVGTRPHSSIKSASAELLELRHCIAEAAEKFGYATVAAGTHPFARWREQTHTPKERYTALRHDIGHPARRLLICGMHNHIGVEDEDLRIDLMNQATYFLPHLLALSCSSPYWEGEDTGLASYRLSVFDALPRTGHPDPLSSYGEYRRLIQHLVESECIEDATKIWWDIRPSAKFPTLEQRITDVCSKLDEAIAITATFQSLIAFLYRLRSWNQRWRGYSPTLINENRWRAQRYGIRERMVDHGKVELVPYADLVEEIIELVKEDAEELGCMEEVLNIRKIVEEGNSTDRQRRVYEEATAAGYSSEDACRRIVEHLIAEFDQV